jgi:hypothetical protein
MVASSKSLDKRCRLGYIHYIATGDNEMNAIKTLMKKWALVEASARKKFPDASDDEIYRLVANRINVEFEAVAV